MMCLARTSKEVNDKCVLKMDYSEEDSTGRKNHNLSIYLPLRINLYGGHRRAVLRWSKAGVVLDNSVGKYSVKPPRPGR